MTILIVDDDDDDDDVVSSVFGVTAYVFEPSSRVGGADGDVETPDRHPTRTSGR